MFFQAIFYGQTYFVLICSLYVLHKHKSCFNNGYMKDGWSTGPCVNNSHSQSRGNPGTIFPPGWVVCRGDHRECASEEDGVMIGIWRYPEYCQPWLPLWLRWLPRPILCDISTQPHMRAAAVSPPPAAETLQKKWEEANCRAVLKYYSGAILEVYCSDSGAIYTSQLPSGLTPSI